MLRFTPSSTQNMYIGDLQVAIFNYIIAKQRNEDLLLIIDDSDRKQNVEEEIEKIAKILNQFELKFDNMIYQSENLKFHRQIAMKLLQEKKAFSCFCTKEILEGKKQIAKKSYKYDDTCLNLEDSLVIDNENPFVVRVKRSDRDITFNDYLQNDIIIKEEDLDSFVLLREDKYPTYDFACAIDDMIHNISLVICENNHILNTSKQIYILQLLDYNKGIDYLYLPSILNNDGNKMGKDDKYASVNYLIDEGFLPQAIANYLISITYKTQIDIFTIDESIKWFDYKKLLKSSVKFDIDKLKFINKAHLKTMDDAILAGILGYSGKNIGSIAKLYLVKLATLNDLKIKLDAMFSIKEELEGFEEEFMKIKEYLQNSDIEYEDFNHLKKDLKETLNLKDEFLLKPLYYLFTGYDDGVSLSDLYPLIKNYLKDIIR
jgi:glutamyl-tRNA synthetase